MNEPKIPLEQYRTLRKLVGKLGADIQTDAPDLKVINTDYEKLSDIIEVIGKTTGIENWD